MPERQKTQRTMLRKCDQHYMHMNIQKTKQQR